MGKIEDAIKKINGEVQKNHSNTYLVLVGEHIIDCIVTEEAGEKVLQAGKSLESCLGHIQKEAAKQKSGSVAVIEDATVYRWAREYFGLETTERKLRLELVKPQMSAEEPKKRKHLSLDDFF